MIISSGEMIPDNLLSYSFAPGYGDITLIVELNDGAESHDVRIVFNATDTATLRRYLRDVEKYDRGLSDEKESKDRPTDRYLEQVRALGDYPFDR